MTADNLLSVIISIFKSKVAECSADWDHRKISTFEGTFIQTLKSRQSHHNYNPHHLNLWVPYNNWRSCFGHQFGASLPGYSFLYAWPIFKLCYLISKYTQLCAWLQFIRFVMNTAPDDLVSLFISIVKSSQRTEISADWAQKISQYEETSIRTLKVIQTHI